MNMTQIRWEDNTVITREEYWKRIRDHWNNIDPNKFPLGVYFCKWIDEIEIRFDYDREAQRLVATISNLKDKHKQHKIGTKLPFYHVYL